MINIKKKHFDMLTKIFNEYCPNAEIWAYGSRIREDSHSASDLDLVVKSFNDTSKSADKLGELLNDSDIPFLTDIHDFERLPKYFQDEILKNYVIVFPDECIGGSLN